MLCSQGKEGGSGLCIPFGMGKCPSHFLLDAGMVNSGFLLVGCRAGIQLQMNRRDGADSLGLCWVPLSANGKCQGSSREFQGNFRGISGEFQDGTGWLGILCQNPLLGWKPSLPECPSSLLFLNSPGIPLSCQPSSGARLSYSWALKLALSHQKKPVGQSRRL